MLFTFLMMNGAFLSGFIGRSLSNSVINLGIQDQYADALTQLGFEFEVLAEQVNTLLD